MTTTPKTAEAYDMIDRYLRNNLDDTDYAEYSAALEVVRTAQQAAEPVAWQYRWKGDERWTEITQKGYAMRSKWAPDVEARALYDRPSAVPAQGVVGAERSEDLIAQIVNSVAELPDRNSPEDWPEAMLVTMDELSVILREALSQETGA